MSRIDELIAELAPDGVRYVETARIFDLRNGYTPSKSNTSFWSDGTIPWFRMEDLRANGGVLDRALQQIPEVAVKGGRLFPANSLLVATSATIGEHALVTVPHLSNQRFTSLSVKPEYAEQIDMKFIYYYGFVLDEWCRNNTSTSSFASVDMTGFKKFRFPLPPLEVQREIVRMLDRFTQLKAELEAELVARRRQYEHYRQIEMSFDDSVSRVQLGDVVEVRSGWGFPNAHQGQSVGEYPFYKVSDMNLLGNETVMSRANHFVSEEVAKKLGVRPAPAGTIIFPKIGAAVATNKKRVLSVASAYDNNVMGLIPTERIDSRYLYHWIQTFDLSRLANESGAVPSIRKSEAERVPIPLPGIAVQRRIVDKLDRFDALVNDLSVGLPAELAARSRQYEYYRDRLLTFEEAMA